jgi:AraC family transcriptional regulator
VQLQELVYGSGTYQAPHAHEYSSISMIVSGSLLETAARTEWNGGAGSIIVKPRDIVHDDTYGARGARMFTLLLPEDDEIGRYRWFFGGSPAALFTRAIREWRAGAAFEDLAADLIGATYGGSLTAVRASTMAAVAERVATTDVTVAALAREFSMHPVALTRAFRRQFGCSLTAWRRRARIRRAVELLSSTRMPLAEVALESGFSDQSHLCRVFHSDLGVTPGVFRTATA